MLTKTVYLSILMLYILVSEFLAIVTVFKLIRYHFDKKYAKRKPVLWSSDKVYELILFSTLLWLPVAVIILLKDIMR